MSWISKTLTSHIGRKFFMALTGLFLIIFLLGHLAGNLQLIYADGAQFNAYARFMTTNIGVKALSYITYACIILHIIFSIWLSMANKKARPIGYHSQNASASSSLSSRNMGILGTLILVFLVIHLQGFWAKMHWGGLPMDANGNTDLYAVVIGAYQQPWYVAIYVISMVIVGFHLSHGFQSAFQTLGLNHVKYSPAIKKTGMAFSFVVAFLFALIPIVIYFKSM